MDFDHNVGAHALSILNELKTRASLGGMSEISLDMFYARAKTKLWKSSSGCATSQGLGSRILAPAGGTAFCGRNTRSTWRAASSGGGFLGTSNTYLAYKHDMEAIGTNAHELPMALAAMAEDDDALLTAQYRVLELWQRTYQGELLIMLPDTFGTTQFLRSAPDWTADWTGVRIDSKDPFLAGDEYIAWLKERGRDPRGKLLIASDALDVDLILSLHAYFAGTIVGQARPEDFGSAADFTIRASGYRNGGSDSAPDGVPCSPTTFAVRPRQRRAVRSDQPG